MYEDHDEHVKAGSCPSIYAASGLWCQMPPHVSGNHWASRGDQSQPGHSKDRVYWTDVEAQ